MVIASGKWHVAQGDTVIKNYFLERINKWEASKLGNSRVYISNLMC